MYLFVAYGPHSAVPAIHRRRNRFPALNAWIGSPAGSGTFSVVSYNVLAPMYATDDKFGYCPKGTRHWDNRVELLTSAISVGPPDIMCMQELQFSKDKGLHHVVRAACQLIIPAALLHTLCSAC
jgi:mRNA deadenylase 3'-5' endonuclease subunit Ccr4